MTADLLHDILTAKRGSRELSDRFLLAMGWKLRPARLGKLTVYEWRNPAGKKLSGRRRPSPTENMQDTLEAVPEGLQVSHMAWGKDGAVVVLGPYRAPDFDLVDAKDPRLALCAAILQAKGAQDGS